MHDDQGHRMAVVEPVKTSLTRLVELVERYPVSRLEEYTRKRLPNPAGAGTLPYRPYTCRTVCTPAVLLYIPWFIAVLC